MLVHVDKIKRAYDLFFQNFLPIAGVVLATQLIQEHLGLFLISGLTGQESGFFLFMMTLVWIVFQTVIFILQFIIVNAILYVATHRDAPPLKEAIPFALSKFTPIFVAQWRAFLWILVGYLKLIIPGILRTFRSTFISYLVLFDDLPYEKARDHSVRMMTGRVIPIFVTVFVSVIPLVILAVLMSGLNLFSERLVHYALDAFSGVVWVVVFLFFLEAREAERGNLI